MHTADGPWDSTGEDQRLAEELFGDLPDLDAVLGPVADSLGSQAHDDSLVTIGLAKVEQGKDGEGANGEDVQDGLLEGPGASRDGKETGPTLEQPTRRRATPLTKVIYNQLALADAMPPPQSLMRATWLGQSTEMKPQECIEESSEIDIRGLPLQDMSLSGRFPAGREFVSVARMRNTVNAYVDRMATDGWFQDYKLGTTQVLERRLKNHREAIVGKVACSVQVAHKQLHARINASISLCKCLKHWLGTQDDANLVNTLDHIGIQVAYLASKGLPLAEDLTVIFGYSVFQAYIKKHNKVSTAIEHLSMVIFDLMRQRPEEAAQDQGPEHPAKIEVKEKCDEPADKKARKATKRRIPWSSSQPRCRFGVSAKCRMACMVAEAMRSYLYSLPDACLELKKTTDEFVTEISAAVHAWACAMEPLTGDNDDDESIVFTRVLGAIGSIVKCCSAAESERLTSVTVRDARNTVLEQTRQSGQTPAAELARTMIARKAPKDAVEVSRLHVARNVEGEAASKSFASAVAAFESDFQDAFGDLENWVASKATGAFTSINDQVALMGKLLAGAMLSLHKWSASALADDEKLLTDTTQNSESIIDARLYAVICTFGVATPVQCDGLGQRIKALTKSRLAVPTEESTSQEGASVALATAAAEARSGSFSVSAILGEFRDGMIGFGATLGDMWKRLRTCEVALNERSCPDATSERFQSEQKSNMSFQARLDSTIKGLTDMVDYVNSAATLALIFFEQHVDRNVSERVISMAKHVHMMKHDPVVFEVTSAATNDELVAKVWGDFQRFMDDVGVIGSAAVRRAPLTISFR
ncbi:unnamed protein product [Prorocentrum cordatum]|uniref:Exocyst complex component n=1 Tax=Prorocentrum cordatum TaxID=2364126 RepID=A0ABN9SGE5_9DINO|nr:unnamed protein product [Polarella glacialis]